MTTDVTEIENVLKMGEKILSERPELFTKNLHDVICELDDGTQQMTHNRWGVAAWLVVKSIKIFDLQTLIEQLSEIDSEILTYEYAGYLLQKEYKINLEKLILEAEECGKFDRIVLYVGKNLIYKSDLDEQYIPKVLNMVEKHMGCNNYHTFLMNYAMHITNMGAQRLAEETLGDLGGQAQYEFMQSMRREWYKKDPGEADAVIGRMLEHKSIWSKKTAIDFLETSLYYGRATFLRHFSQMENLILENEELWQMIIPIFVKYLMEADDDTGVESIQIRHCVLKYLEKIPNSSLEVKCIFVEVLQWEDRISKELTPIFHKIISNSFNGDRHMLDILDSHLYCQLQKGKWRAALQIMLEAFTANRYLADYQDFFVAMDSSKHGLLNYTAEVTIEALDYMLLGGVERFFFGLGLLMEVGDLQKLRNGNDDGFGFTGTFTDVQMIHLMKGILYYSVNNKRICHMAFQFLEFSGESSEIYVEFCMKEVYGNYPATMNESARQYKTSYNEKQVHLSEMVMKAHEWLLDERKMGYEIKDLQPSNKRQYIYHRAQMEQNRRINKMANEKSVLAQLFNRSTLKYGVRSAYIMTGRKDEKSYQVNPYMQHEYQVEIPAVYVKDPVAFELTRKAYWEEVIHDAVGDKGLSASTKRKR